jgi:hypothetical protein
MTATLTETAGTPALEATGIDPVTARAAFERGLGWTVENREDLT